MLLLAAPSPTSWLSVVARDLKSISLLPPFKDMAGWSLCQWVLHLRDRPKFFVGLRSAFASPDALHPSWWADERWMAKLRAAPAEAWPCYTCGQAFKPKPALATHRFKMHGDKKPARRLVSTTWCPVCMVEFHTRFRCLQHLSMVRAGKQGVHNLCCDILLAAGPVCSAAEADELDSRDQQANRILHSHGHCPTKAIMPAFRRPGPLCKARALRDISLAHS